jgi:uncharacterized protein (TIGR03437 family)
LNKASLAIRGSLKSPDILAVQEMENLTALQALRDRLNSDAIAASQPNPQYEAYLVEGNDIGGIDVGFLVKLSRVAVVDVTQFGKTATFTDPTDGSTDLIFDRPPLVLRARATRPGSTTTMTITVIALHLRSLSGIADADGRVRAKRKAGADFVANLVQSRQVADPSENIVVLGDFNAFDVSDGYVDVTNTIRGVPAAANTVVLSSPAVVNPTLTNILQQVPAARRYSYTFDGDTQFLDQILVNQPLMAKFNRVDVAHNNADFPESYRNDPNRPERISDHDMPIAYFLLPTQSAPPVSSAIVNGASFLTGPIAPGEIVTLFGAGLGPAQLVKASPGLTGAFGTELAGVRVRFNGVPAPLLFVRSDQIGLVVPYAVGSTAAIEVEYAGGRSNMLAASVAATAPAIFSADSTGRGQGAILNQNGQLNSTANPADRGTIVVLFATGEGETDPPGVDGKPAVEPYPRPLARVSVTIGGQPAEILYAGAAPGLVAGVLQVNARVPLGIAPGPAQVVFKVGNQESPASITVAIR